MNLVVFTPSGAAYQKLQLEQIALLSKTERIYEHFVKLLGNLLYYEMYKNKTENSPMLQLSDMSFSSGYYDAGYFVREMKQK
jgi:hypothetical protein